MKDYMIRGTDCNRNFRFFGANTKDMINTAVLNHGTSPVVSAALGRTMTGAAMMGKMLKNDTDRVSVAIKGDGPIQGIVVEADTKGNVKGFPYVPVVDIPLNQQGKLDVRSAIGNAVMIITKDIGLKEPYVGQVAMLSGEIAEDFTYYFATSEQINSVVILGVLVDIDYTIKQAGGLIIEVLPGCSEEAIDELENKIRAFGSLTTLLDEGLTIEEVLKQLLGEIDIMEETHTRFKCDCSEERMERGLISIGREDLVKIVEEEDSEPVELVCHFCNQKYHFEKQRIKEILESLSE